MIREIFIFKEEAEMLKISPPHWIFINFLRGGLLGGIIMAIFFVARAVVKGLL